MKKKLTALALACVFLLTTAFAAGFAVRATLRPDIRIFVDGAPQNLQNEQGETVYPILYNGTAYLPLRAIGELSGRRVCWNEADKTISLMQDKVSKDGYSRQNPAPLGVRQALTAGVDEGKTEILMHVSGIIRGEAAFQKLKAENRFVKAPREDMEYLLAEVTAKVERAGAGQCVEFNSYLFSACREDGTDYTEFFSAVCPAPVFDGTVFEGGSVSGYAVFMVEKDDEKPRASFSDSDTWFALYE